jgi:hypothetical protein
MIMMTQEHLQTIWHKYAGRLDNDADSDVVRADFHEELGRLGGIVLSGRGGLDREQADALLDTLQEKGCAVLHDPAGEGEDAALVLFLPDQAADEGKRVSA